MPLDLSADIVTLTAEVCDIESVSGNEKVLADAVERSLREFSHLTVSRDGDAVVARTDLARSQRIAIAGHLDTVPIAANLPTWRQGETLHGRGTCDMKGGVAVALKLAAEVREPVHDVTYIFYDHEEVEAAKNGLGRLARNRPEHLQADFAILMEPTGAIVEGGCQGSMRVTVTVPGEAAHSARSWRGSNAIHTAGEVLRRLAAYEPRRVEVEGLEYREGLNAVGITGGIAGNVIPDTCEISINYRFAPDRTPAEAEAHLREVLAPYDLDVTDLSAPARPGLHLPAAAAFVAAMGGEARPKFGWTDVARFAELGIPAVNFGPGDPSLAHRDDEAVPFAHLEKCEFAMRAWLSGS